jgi:hypothetical protein
MSSTPANERRGYNTTLKTDTAAGYATCPSNPTVVRTASRVKHLAAFSEGSLPRLAQKTSGRAEAGSKKGPFYKPLPKEFRRDGFNYRQIARQGDGAIYEQTWTGSDNPSPCWEVIRIRRREGFHSAADLSNLRKFIQIRKPQKVSAQLEDKQAHKKKLTIPCNARSGISLYKVKGGMI